MDTRLKRFKNAMGQTIGRLTSILGRLKDRFLVITKPWREKLVKIVLNPNFLTLLRIAATPILVVLLMYPAW